MIELWEAAKRANLTKDELDSLKVVCCFVFVFISAKSIFFSYCPSLMLRVSREILNQILFFFYSEMQHKVLYKIKTKSKPPSPYKKQNKIHYICICVCADI